MKKTSAKPKGATSYKETKFGIISRSKLLPMEIEGTKKGLDFIFRLVSKDKSDEFMQRFKGKTMASAKKGRKIFHY